MAKSTVILIPGLLCSPRLFEAQKPALSAWAHVEIVDHDRSDTMAGIAGTILDEAPRRFSLAGLSMGGYIAFEIMRQQPERVERLALLNTQARADTPEIREDRLRLLELAEEEGVVEVQHALMPKLIRQDRIGEESLTTNILKMAEETSAAGFVRQMHAIMDRPDSRDTLGRIDCPTLVAVGEQDILTPPERSQEMVDLLPDGRLEVIPDCGHLSTMEVPDTMNAMLSGWLQS